MDKDIVKLKSFYVISYSHREKYYSGYSKY